MRTKFEVSSYTHSRDIEEIYAKTLFIDFSWTIDVVNAHAPHHVT